MPRATLAIIAVAFSVVIETVYGSDRIRLISTFNGDAADVSCNEPGVSASGRTVCFSSAATNLASDDKNDSPDIFVSEFPFVGCRRVSLTWDGDESPDARAIMPSISPDGLFIAFTAGGSDFVEHDQNGFGDIFLTQSVFRTVERISVNAAGDEANGGSSRPVFGPRLESVIFTSGAKNLIDSDTNNTGDVFMKNLRTGEVELISLRSDGVQGDKQSGSCPSAISSDGRYTAFESDATNLVSNDKNKSRDVFVRDRKAGTTTRASLDDNQREGGSDSYLGGMSADGRYIVFSTLNGLAGGDWNENEDVYLRDMQSRKTFWLSPSSLGGSREPAISANGRYIVFDSVADDFDDRSKDRKAQIYIYDRRDNGKLTLLSVNDDDKAANDDCTHAAISPNGRFVTFLSRATNLTDLDIHGVLQVYWLDALGCTPFKQGDSNCDGKVNSDDIDAFVLALIDESQYSAEYLACDWQCSNDINGDEVVDFNDIDGFVECLINNGCE